MTGTLINAGAIVLAGFCGLLLRRKITENISNTKEKALVVLIIVLGIQYGIKAENFDVIGLSLAGGEIIGEWRN